MFGFCWWEMQMSEEVFWYKAMTWISKKAFLLFFAKRMNIWKDHQQRKHTHKQSLKPRFYQTTKSSSTHTHTHICKFWQTLPLGWQTAVLCTPPLPVSMSHLSLFVLWSTKDPVSGGDWCWQAGNTICSSSLTQSSSATLIELVLNHRFPNHTWKIRECG